MTELHTHLPHPSLKLTPSETVRGVIKEATDTIYILLYNLNIERLSSYEDKIRSARDVFVSIRISKTSIKHIILYTPEKDQEIIEYEIKK